MEDTTENPLFIVGIGASAGGLNALQEFFQEISKDSGAAYVVVQHLSPDYKSMMSELLAKITPLPIEVIEDDTLIQPNHIYLMPPRQDMKITENRLYLAENNGAQQPHLPIDTFFEALAFEAGCRAIGVILSGTGSDGTRGVKLLKENDGLIIVQDPANAKFDGMPISACRTGLVDIILPASEIAKAIENYIHHYPENDDSPILQTDDEIQLELLNVLFSLVNSAASIDFSKYKASTVARRIERRMGIQQISTLKSYVEQLKSNPIEVETLAREILIGVTRFFRDEEHFNFFKSEVIPKLFSTAIERGSELRVWVAACSTGEEAYSISILLQEYVNQNNIEMKFSVFATDVDESAIATASQGIYTPEIQQDIEPEYLERYFEAIDNGFKISQDIRSKVIFASHNMIEDPPFSSLDLVSCRNVLIYFKQAAQQEVISSFYYGLRSNGILFLGQSETPGELRNHFSPMSDRLKIYQKIPGMAMPMTNKPIKISNTEHDYKLSSTRAIASPSRNQENSYLIRVLERLVNDQKTNSIIINHNFEAIHVYGNVEKYVKRFSPGKISNNIKDLVVDDLSVAISTALFRCQREGEDVYYHDIEIKSDTGEVEFIDLITLNVSSEYDNQSSYYVVQFIHSEIQEKSIPQSHSKVEYNASEQARQRIRDLERELMRKQEHLQITIEELETTNEELQSANEELMSANEELQSTNEELQSVNEELYTVNSEYQEKIGELTQTNDDLDSVINATDIGIIFLDNDLSVRKYTSPVERFIHLRRSDIDRPFHHISHELIYEDLLIDIASVSSSGEEVEKTIMSRQEHTLLIRILPYKNRNTLAATSYGVVLTITNISRRRFVENALKSAQEQLRETIIGENRLQGRTSENKKLNILVLDDDDIDRMRIVRLLESIPMRDFTISSHTRIEDAIKAFDSLAFDLCLVDYHLAGSTARDFVGIMKEQSLESPVVILSGYSEEGLDTEFLNSEISDFLNKDELSSQLLIRSIDYVIERSGIYRILTD